MREITLSKYTVELDNNIREIFSPRILKEVISTHNIITIEIKNKENLARLESFFKTRFLTKELYYIDEDNIVVYYINNSKFKEYNEFSKKKIKESLSNCGSTIFKPSLINFGLAVGSTYPLSSYTAFDPSLKINSILCLFCLL